MGFVVLGILIVVIVWVLVVVWFGNEPSSPKPSRTREKSGKRRRKETPPRSRNGSGADLSITIHTSTELTSRSTAELLAQSRSAWHAPGARMTVGGRSIPDGMVYVGKELAPVDGYQNSDPTLINPGLDAASRNTDRSGKNLSYWPAYANIPSASRGAYLDWLADGRRRLEYGIGYVFIFFYGLERRILFDARHDSEARKEVPALIGELEALKATYGARNRSFDGYCDSLIAYARQAFGGNDAVHAPAYETSADRYWMSRQEKIELGRIIASGEPLTADWALAWVRSDPEVRLRTPGTRCREEFDVLFRYRYRDRFGKGIRVDATHTTLHVSHRPASGGIRKTFNERIDGAVDVDRVSIPSALVDYANDVESALDDYSRWIGWRDDRTSLAALGQLPPEIIRERAGDDARAFIDRIETWMDGGDHAVIPSTKLLRHWPSKNEDYLTKTEAEALSGFLAGFDFGVEPDVRYTRNPSKREHLTIFELPGPDRPPGASFASARLLLHLAAAVAGANEEIAAGEEEHIERHLEESLDLGGVERARLRAHLARLLKHPPTLRGVRRRADDLDEHKRRQLGTFLLTVAGADGHLDGDEIKVLEKIYDILGLGEDQVHQDLHDLAARGPGTVDRGPVTVVEADEEEAYDLPGDEANATARPEPSVQAEGVDLDLDRVAAVQNETCDVARVLDDVFSDDEEEDPPAFTVDGLTDEHEALLLDLSARGEWPRAEFDALAERYGLLPGFAIEQINDRAFEVADEPLLEGDDPIELNPYALDALQS